MIWHLCLCCTCHFGHSPVPDIHTCSHSLYALLFFYPSPVVVGVGLCCDPCWRYCIRLGDELEICCAAMHLCSTTVRVTTPFPLLIFSQLHFYTDSWTDRMDGYMTGLQPCCLHLNMTATCLHIPCFGHIFVVVVDRHLCTTSGALCACSS